jgi:hypothetical protein
MCVFVRKREREPHLHLRRFINAMAGTYHSQVCLVCERECVKESESQFV